MITLNDISLKEVVFDPMFRKFFKDNNIYSIGELKEFLIKNPKYDYETLRNDIKRVEKNIKKLNNKGVNPEVFYTKEYSNKDLKFQDEFNKGGILLLDNPIPPNPTTYLRIKDKTIVELKKDLSLATSNGKSYIYNYRNIGKTNIPKILNAIEMYEDQIERQAKLVDDLNSDIFSYNIEEKIDITEQIYQDIIMYLVNNAESKLVWGNLSDTQKRLYLSSIVNKTKYDLYIKNNIIRYVSDYTTLPELEKMEKDKDLKVLKRFIEK